MKKLSVTEQLMYTTTRVECVNKNGDHYQATAFFYKLFVDKNRYFEVLVSNRHVFENMNEITFHITVASNEGDPTKEYYNYNLSLDGDVSKVLFLHPNPKVDYKGQPMFLIDCACIQGSSGSPIFSVHKGYMIDKHGKPLNKQGQTIELMGIQSSIPVRIQLAELAVVNVPTAKKAVANVNIPLNLGYIIKAEKLLDFIPILQTLLIK